MNEDFSDMLAVGGKTNSPGRADEVVESVLKDRERLEELYGCLFHDDSWLRMRAADCLEKVCRVHPDWLLPYIDKFETDLRNADQPSIQWHLAQIYAQVELTPRQKKFVIDWLRQLLSTTQVDWIVSANAMTTLVNFAKRGSIALYECRKLIEIQLHHRSKSVVKRANKLLSELEAGAHQPPADT